MNVIITGANRGLGKEMVKAFAENGHNVWACARKYNKEFEDGLAQLSRENQSDIVPVYFDLANAEEIKSGMQKILFEKKNVDILINNAGISYRNLMTMTPIDEIRKIYEINVFSQIQVMQYVARKMMKQKSGSIINICSMGGIEPAAGLIAYGSSKAALIWITRSLARELGPYHIRVNGIAPGLIDTEMGRNSSRDDLAKKFDRMVIKRFGKPQEVAAAALYLSSQAAAFMTGQIIVLDGGWV